MSLDSHAVERSGRSVSRHADPVTFDGVALAHARAAQVVDDDRMDRNATALIASSVLTSALGFVFWIVAARTLTTAEVGTGGALVAALVLLGNMATMGMRNALPRFLPAARTHTRSLIATAYAVAGLVGLGLGLGFAAGSGWWAPDLALIRSGWTSNALFAAAVAAWAVFILQDSVLVGLRSATWIPIENLIYALAKLGLLVVIASTGDWALLIAWMVPAVVVMVPLNIGIFTRLAGPGLRGAASRVTPTAPSWRAVARFAAGDHFADIVRYLGAEGVLLVVVAHLGPEPSAPLFFAITISASLQLLSSNIVSAFVAEAAARPHDAPSLLRRAAVRAIRLVLPAAIGAALVAPLVLSIFGSRYADEGAFVLRMLLLAAVPQVVIALAIGLSRFERKVARVVAIAFGSALGPLIAAALFVPTFGLAAVGWGALIGHTTLAAVLLLTVLRSDLFGDSSVQSMAVDALVGTRNAVRNRRRRRVAATVFDELDASRTGEIELHPRTLIPTSTDVAVARIDNAERPLIVKVALSESADTGLTEHSTALAAMRRATHGSLTQRLLPEPVEVGTSASHSFVIESACPGRSPSSPDDATLASVAAAFSALHRATARPARTWDDVPHWVLHRPMRVLMTDPRLDTFAATLARLSDALERALRHEEIRVARTHGDCWLGNVLMDSSNGVPFVTGVIDWENSVEVGIPEIDLAHLWLSAYPGGMASGVLHSLTQGRFVDLAGPCATDATNPDIPAGLVVTLAWLAHIADGIERSSRFGLGSVWMKRNVTPVLDAIDRGYLERLLEPARP